MKKRSILLSKGNLPAKIITTFLYLCEKKNYDTEKGGSPMLCLVKEMNYEKNSHFSIGTGSRGCIFSDGRSVSGNLCCDHDDLSVNHERSVHELRHVNVLLLSVSAGNVLLSSSYDLCSHQVL